MFFIFSNANVRRKSKKIIIHIKYCFRAFNYERLKPLLKYNIISSGGKLFPYRCVTYILKRLETSSGVWAVKSVMGRIRGVFQECRILHALCIYTYITLSRAGEFSFYYYSFHSPRQRLPTAPPTLARLGRYRVKIHKTAELWTARRPILSLGSTLPPPRHSARDVGSFFFFFFYHPFRSVTVYIYSRPAGVKKNIITRDCYAKSKRYRVMRTLRQGTPLLSSSSPLVARSLKRLFLFSRWSSPVTWNTN